MSAANPTALEADVLIWIGENSRDRAIAAQAKIAVVLRREHTGHGYFVELGMPEDVARAIGHIGDTNPFPGPFIESPEIPHGADTVGFVNDGMIETLEIFSYGESFPEHLASYKLVSMDRGR